MDQQESTSSPLPVIPLEYAPPENQSSRAARILALLDWAAAASALGAIFVIDVESVLVSGPILLVLGVITITCAWRARIWPALVLGASLCAVCLLFVMLVNLLNWPPAKADLPFRWMGAAYVALSAIPTFLIFVDRRISLSQ